MRLLGCAGFDSVLAIIARRDVYSLTGSRLIDWTKTGVKQYWVKRHQHRSPRLQSWMTMTWKTKTMIQRLRIARPAPLLFTLVFTLHSFAQSGVVQAKGHSAVWEHNLSGDS